MSKSTTLKDLLPQLEEKLQAIANTQDVTIISFVAPQGVRTSPVTFSNASITETEMYDLEEKVRRSSSKKLHFVIHTPGGEFGTSYKIANFLRNKFEEISVFVPYQAASGGTILSCAANKIYLGDLGNLTPVDPQVRYKDTRVSSRAIMRAVDSLKENFGEMSPFEVPTPWQQMAEKIDPVIYDEMNTLSFTSWIYAHRLLLKSGYPSDVASQIAWQICMTAYTHEYVIFAEDAKKIGFNVQADDASMSIYRELVSCRLQEQSPKHAIDCFFPISLPPLNQTAIIGSEIVQPPQV